MLDHQYLIQRLKAALNALKAGDNAALDSLRLLVGEVISGAQAEIGSISGSMVVIDRYIEMIIYEGGLPETTVATLNGLIEELRAFMRRGCERHSGERRKVTLFLSSPSDVAEERSLTLKIVDRLNKNQFLPFHIEAFLWEHADMAMFAHRNPQANIDSHIMPADCDIVVVALWSRMGTPMGEEYVKPEAYRFALPAGDDLAPARYLSGTEYEFVNAMQGAEADGQPLVLVYRRTEDILLNPKDQAFLERAKQHRRVNAFFESFSQTDGSARWSYTSYNGPAEFADRFEKHLLDTIGALSYAPAPKTASHAVPVPKPVPWPAEKSPFPGLRPFQPEDAVVFFGREREIDSLVRRLRRDHFVAIVAASGSGKSSLARAGLIPRLLDGALPDALRWAITTAKPGEAEGKPLQALANALNSALPGGGFTAEDKAEALAERTNQALPADEHLLLLVDQFEELFTVVEEAQRVPFAAALDALSRLDRTRVLITMRADFYHRCMEVPTLKALIEDGTFPLYPPDPSQLYDMIARPAGVAGLAFEEGLDERIWRETAKDPGALALVAYTLERLWHAQDNGVLRTEVYDSFGDGESGISGVEGVIGAEAEAAYHALDHAAQDALPMVFAQLVKVTRTENGLVTARCSAKRDEVTGHSDSPMARLVEALEARRLLIADYDDIRQCATVEVAHEAIFRAWGRLRDWIQGVGEALQRIDDLKQQVARWIESGEADSFLWTQEQMDPVLIALETHPELRGRLDDTCWRFLRPEYDRVWDAINAAAPTITTETEVQHHHRHIAALGDRLAELGDSNRRPGVGLIIDNLPPLQNSDAPALSRPTAVTTTNTASLRELRLWGEADTRLGADAAFRGIPDIVWLPVEGGQITVEGQKCEIGRFYIAKYPVTYQQYRAFLEAPDGFAKADWWQGLGQRPSSTGKQNRMSGNHPAENVSWYDAVAFCRWLTNQLGLPDIPLSMDAETLRAYQGIRLPTEWEWQWAACGGDPRREYPWGAWNSDMANTVENKLNRTTAVGVYPAGAARCGALDMSGNVSEWCLNEPDPGTEISIGGGNARIQRGGSFYEYRTNACCASRSSRSPYVRIDFTGFRLACSHG